MNIKEVEAFVIARRFTVQEYTGSKLSIVDGKEEITFEKHGFGHTVLGLTENYWSITFILKGNGQNVFYSGCENFTVLVGADSGEPHWLPVM